MSLFSVLSLFCLIACLNAVNLQPVIGIFSIPSDEDAKDPLQWSYFPASYVKQIEGAGAMVVVIPWDSSYEELDFFLNRIDGLFFTGGDSKIYLNESSPGYTFNKLTDSASYLLGKIIQMNDDGHHFPVMGY